MNIIDAYWEKRNLGVSCKELNCELNDNIADVKKIVSSIDADYTVIRVPSPKVDLLFYFQSIGFFVIETNIHLVKNLRDIELPFRYQKYESRIVARKANTDEVNKIMGEIRNGVFDTDKIALDPLFSLKQSANRYENWVSEELNKKSTAYIVANMDKDIGFFILRNDDDTNYNALFGALYKDTNATGFGFAVGYSAFKVAKKLSAKTIFTAVSSNNLAALRMNLSIGYEIDNVHYVLIKHRLNE